MSEAEERFEQQVHQTLAELVSIDSVNPTLSAQGGGEARITEYLERFFGELGAEVTRQPVFENRCNLIARLKGRDSRRSLMFEAHMDTVGIASMEVDPLGAAVVDGRLYGRGACDTKGSMAGMICALRELVRREGRPPIDLVFVGSMDEEYRAAGIYALVDSGFRPDAAVVGEPTGLSIVTAHKGCFRFDIVTRGKAVQSSKPEQGINAICKMADVIDAVRSRLEPACRARRHALVGSPTINLGIIAGGREVNTVPDICRLTVDRRVIPGESREQVEGEFLELIAALGKADPSFSAGLENQFFDPALDVDQDTLLVRSARQACEQVLGKAELRGVTYGSDASKLAAVGVPSIVLGPGDIVNAHSAREHVLLEEVVQAARIYGRLIEAYAG